MSDGTDKDAKTEEATPRRMEDALQKGNIPVSRELVSFAAIAALPIAIGVAAAAFSGRTLDVLQKLIDSPHEFRIMTASDATDLAILVGVSLLPSVVLPLLVLSVAGLAATLVQNAPRISSERIKPDLARISIGKGWERIFGAHSRVEFMKALFKFGLLGALGAMFFSGQVSSLLDALQVAPRDLPGAIVGQVTDLFVALSAMLAALAIADVVWSRMRWRADLRMSKQEVKDEHKQSEGDPIVRARQRSIARDRARRRMLSSVPRATLVVANPTHYAIALRYVKGEQAAPLVIAKGLDHVALRIREIAELNGIPVVEDRALARSLYDAVTPDRPIPPEFYKAVAEILIYLMSRTRAPDAARRPSAVALPP